MRNALLFRVLLLPTHLFHVGFGNYTFTGMDIKSIVKRFFMKRFHVHSDVHFFKVKQYGHMPGQSSGPGV